MTRSGTDDTPFCRPMVSTSASAECDGCDQVANQLYSTCAGAARDLVGLPGVWATVKYLIAVSPPDEKLVKRHARCRAATWITRRGRCGMAVALVCHMVLALRWSQHVTELPKPRPSS